MLMQRVHAFNLWRAVAGGMVLLLHALAIGLFIANDRISVPLRETILNLPVWAPPKIMEAPPLPPREGTRPRATSPMPDNPFVFTPNRGAITITPGARGLGGLLNCSGDISKLPDEQQQACARRLYGEPLGDNAPDYRDRSNTIPGAPRWAREKAKKNAPPLLPCMSPQAAGISLGTLLCLGDGLINGFDPLNQPGYMDKPEDLHTPNNGDPGRLRDPRD